MPPRGAPAPIASGIDQRSKLDGSLGDSNMQERALGFGKVAHGETAGKHDAEYRTFGTRSGTNVYEIQHSLGRKAGFVIKAKLSNPRQPGTHINVEAHEYEKWTDNTVRVHVNLIAGSLDGAEITLLIGGSQ